MAVLTFDPDNVTFTAGMAKRSAPGPFVAAPIVQGDPNNADALTDDVLSFSSGTQISGNFYPNMDTDQGSIVLWWTPEYSYNSLSGSGDHYLWYINSNYYLAYEYDNDRFLLSIGGQTTTISSNIVAGTTYNLVVRWDTKNTLDGTNYACLSIDDTHTFGITTAPTASAPAATIYIGSDGSTGACSGIIEGFTVYRRPLYDGANGIDVGNGDEINKIYNTGSGKDACAVTGSWDVVFCMPTDSSTGALSTGTGEAWSHPHNSNLITPVDGFMLNTTTAWNNWSQEGTPSANGLNADAQKIYAGGYYFTSDAVNEGYYFDITVAEGDDWVVRALAHSDGTAVPKIILYDQTNGAEIGSLTGTSTSTRTAPDVFILTGTAPTGMTTLRVKVINTQSSGTCYWHQVEVLTNNLNNPSYETGAGDPWIPDGWVNNALDAGDAAQETTIVHSGSSSVKFNTGATIWESLRHNSGFPAGFSCMGFWVYGAAGGVQKGSTIYFQYSSTGGGNFTTDDPGAAWGHFSAVFRGTLGNRLDIAGNSNTHYIDDVYVIPLDDVSLTVTPASQANSSETSGLRVDGRDSCTQTITELTTTSGSIKFKYTPRHDAGDAVKFLESTTATDYAYIAEWYYDATNYIRLYWSAANTITLEYNMNGTTGSGTWDATGEIVAGTTYTMQIYYTGGSTMFFVVDGSNKIMLTAIPAAFGTAPNTAYWGSRQA